MLYKWDEKYELGIEEVDDQHRTIFELANALRAAGANPGNTDLVESALFEMRSYVDDHFKDEEAIMCSLESPALEEHCRIHAEMVDKVEGLAEAFETGEVRASDLHVLIVSWLINHIAKEHMKLAHFVREGKEAA